MAEKHPYISGAGGITAAILQFRKTFPVSVTAETLKKLGIAPYNESYVINILRFIGALDPEGNKTAASTAAFSKHNDTEFQQAFGEMVKAAYKDLFDLHGETAWGLSTDDLINFFRTTDQTSDLVGRRQASTFQALAALAGHGEAPDVKPAKKSSKPKAAAKGKPTTGVAKTVPETPSLAVPNGNGRNNVGLTVRVEVNLPAAADQETYDRIFRSIRENLLNAK